MVRSCEQEIPGWVYVGTLLFFTYSVTVSGGKITNELGDLPLNRFAHFEIFN